LITGLHVITDESYVPGRAHLEVAAAAVAGGAQVVQFRDKTASGKRLYEIALEIRKLTAEAGVTFIVNDRVDVAAAVEADGAHVGQDDLPVQAARRLLGSGRIVGVSATTVDEALAAAEAGADYIGFGPIFPTGSKDDAAPPTGLAALRELTTRTSVPVIAIGGVSAANASDVMAAGAAGVAVISAVAAQEDMVQATRALALAVSGPGNPAADY